MSYQRLTLLLACLLLPCVAALGAIPVKGALQNLDLRVHPASYKDRGPAHFYWTGEIHVTPHSGPMTVQYHWVRSDKATTGDTDMVLNPGVDSYQVAYDWELGPFSGSDAKGHVNVQLCVKVTDGGAGGRNSSLVNAQYDFVQPTKK